DSSCNGDRVLHHLAISGAGTVPFEHGEFSCVEGATFAITEHPGEVEDQPFSGGKQLLAGEFRRGVKIKGAPRSVGSLDLSLDAMQMCRKSWRYLQLATFHLDKTAGSKIIASGTGCCGTLLQERPAIFVNVGVVPGGWCHRFRL